MTNSQVSLICLITILVLVIAVPLGIHIWRDFDYKRQINGKRPIRTLKENENITTETDSKNTDMEAVRESYEKYVNVNSALTWLDMHNGNNK